MTKELSTKTRVLMMTDNSKLFITEQQGNQVIKDIKAGAKWVDVDGSFINTFVIAKIVGASEYQEIERKKRGEWKCKCGQWIPKGKSCGYCQA